MTLFFPDNTVLINFAVVNRMDLLESLLNGHGAWTDTVAAECDKSSMVPGLSELRYVRDFLGDPMIPTRVEWIDAQLIRARLVSPFDAASKSFGEASTIAVILRRRLKAVFVTDDRGVHDYVKDEDQAVQLLTTPDLLALAVKVGFIPRTEGDALIDLLVKNGRRIVRSKYDKSFS